MQKLQNVKLRNVLSHENTDCDIAPVLTVFTGDSDSGKSSVVRGLLQACENQPAGINLLRHAAGHGANAETELSVLDKDGNKRTIMRLRGKSRNEYWIDGDPIKAFGLGAPDEVTSILNLSKHAFQIQSDGHFLLSENDGEVARVLGRTVGLSKIDKAFSLIRKQKTENDTDLRVAKKNLEREEAAILLYGGVDLADKILHEYESLEYAVNVKECFVNDIEQKITALIAIPEEVDVSHAEEAIASYKGIECKEASLQCTVLQLEALCTVLENIPSKADVKPATLMLAEFDVVNAECSTCQTKLAALDADINALVRTPRKVSVDVAEWKLERLEEAQTEINSISEMLGAIDGQVAVLQSIPEQCNKLIKETDGKVWSVKSFGEVVYSFDVRLAKIDLALDALKKINIDAVGFTKEIRQIHTEIDKYAAEHPVCPECGAQQEHWYNPKD